MSIVKIAPTSQRLVRFPSAGSDSLIPARSPVSTPLDSGRKAFVTPEEQLRLLDEDIYYLQNLISELIVEDAYPDEDMRDCVAELRHSRDERDEIIHLMRELSRFRVTEEPPRNYEEWIPWAYERVRPHAPKETEEKEPDYGGWRRWARTKKTLVRVPFRAQNTEHASPVVRPPRNPARRSRSRFWLLKIALRRFWFAISVTRSR